MMQINNKIDAVSEEIQKCVLSTCPAYLHQILLHTDLAIKKLLAPPKKRNIFILSLRKKKYGLWGQI